MKYIKPLDGIRAIAVSLVIIWHWIPRTQLATKLHIGGVGVNIFFVLSGFLITQILLDNRNKAESHNLPKKNVLKNFYVRRVLRIFPIYYLTIIAMIVFNHWLELNVTKGEILSSLTYTSNFYWYFKKMWPAASPHFLVAGGGRTVLFDLAFVDVVPSPEIFTSRYSWIYSNWIDKSGFNCRF